MLRHCACDDTLTVAISVVVRKIGFISKCQSVSTRRTTGSVSSKGKVDGEYGNESDIFARNYAQAEGPSLHANCTFESHRIALRHP